MNANLQYLDFQIPVFFEWPEGVKYKVVTKGRRTGITKGAANAFIELLLDKEGPILWGDTINSNIDKYFGRYFLPELKANNISYHWESQKKQLTIGDQVMDFRSEDNPENWEGFGYKYIFLNEAGIIMKNKDLYVKTVLPMLLDFPDSKLIAAGVPKGKLLKDGTEHPFYKLVKRAEAGNPKYQLTSLTSYDNPLLTPEGIKDLEDEIAELGTQNAVDQEIYGIFVETDAVNPFAHQWDDAYHTALEAAHNYHKQLYISIDFNLNPFAVTFWHYWQDTAGYHLHGIDEAEIQQGSIPAMIELIRSRYSGQLHSCILTGDAMGNQGNIARIDNASHYVEIAKGLHLGEHQIKVPANPTHENSRADMNKILWECKRPEPRFFVKLHPERMKNTIRDNKTVQCDATGKIVKGKRSDLTQRADYLDTERYMFNLVFKQILSRLRPA